MDSNANVWFGMLLTVMLIVMALYFLVPWREK